MADFADFFDLAEDYAARGNSEEEERSRDDAHQAYEGMIALGKRLAQMLGVGKLKAGSPLLLPTIHLLQKSIFFAFSDAPRRVSVLVGGCARACSWSADSMLVRRGCRWSSCTALCPCFAC